MGSADSVKEGTSANQARPSFSTLPSLIPLSGLKCSPVEAPAVHEPVLAGAGLAENPRFRHVAERFRGDFRFGRQPELEWQKGTRKSDQKPLKPHLESLPQYGSAVPQPRQRNPVPARNTMHLFSTFPPPTED